MTAIVEAEVGIVVVAELVAIKHLVTTVEGILGTVIAEEVQTNPGEAATALLIIRTEILNVSMTIDDTEMATEAGTETMTETTIEITAIDRIETETIKETIGATTEDVMTDVEMTIKRLQKDIKMIEDGTIRGEIVTAIIVQTDNTLLNLFFKNITNFSHYKTH